ncbi:hypothetical protein L596_015222 [Steinernema carpocapsae]|uniref:Uncharacterized protein n=1 Tax=Steinernema carpocapsae TaxID=34508 RepID=A0A4U5NED0_STECR|nr:hypothetical protein L596_015222 [Steinernema carpocapsae]
MRICERMSGMKAMKKKLSEWNISENTSRIPRRTREGLRASVELKSKALCSRQDFYKFSNPIISCDL